MKFLFAATVSLFMMSAMAEDLNSMKKDANTKIDKEISVLQKSKTCVNSATSVDKFKACKLDMKEDSSMMQKMEEGKDKLDDAL